MIKILWKIAWKSKVSVINWKIIGCILKSHKFVENSKWQKYAECVKSRKLMVGENLIYVKILFFNYCRIYIKTK